MLILFDLGMAGIQIGLVLILDGFVHFIPCDIACASSRDVFAKIGQAICAILT